MQYFIRKHVPVLFDIGVGGNPLFCWKVGNLENYIFFIIAIFPYQAIILAQNTLLNNQNVSIEGLHIAQSKASGFQTVPICRYFHF